MKNTATFFRKKRIKSTKGRISYEEALDEIVADGCEMMLRDSEAIRKLAETNKPLFQKVRDWVGKFLKSLREAFKGLSAEHSEAVYLMENYADELQKLWDDALTASVENGKNASEGQKIAPRRARKRTILSGSPIMPFEKHLPKSSWTH